MIYVTTRQFVLVTLCSLFCWLNATAQHSNEQPKIKKCWLKGNWQLVQTFAQGTTHEVKKEEYNGVMRLHIFHKYSEEVTYESNHWIIEGKWYVNHKKHTLTLTQRTYTLGTLENKPADIVLTVTGQSKKMWAGSATVSGSKVSVVYNRIAQH